MPLLELIGRWALASVAEMGRMLIFMVTSFAWLARPPLRGMQIVKQLHFIGYKSTQVEGVRVLAGQTNTVDVQLEQTAVEIQEITVVSQTQPLVPRDEVTSRQRLDGDVVRELPADRINQRLFERLVIAATVLGGLQLLLNP